MVVFSFISLVIKFLCYIEVRKLGGFDEVSIDFKGKGSKALVIDASSSLDVFFDVLSECLDDEMELSLGVKGFGSFVGTWL